MSEIFNFIVSAGKDYQAVVDWDQPGSGDIDIATPGWAGKLTAKLKRSDPTPLFELTTSDGLTLNSSGQCIVTIRGDRSAAWNFSCCVYDLLIWDPAVPGGERLIQGTILVSPGVSTRP